MLKRIGHSRVIVSIVGALVWLYMVLVVRTLRWTVEGEDHARDLWRADLPFALVAWHSRNFLMPVVHLKLSRKWGKRSMPTSIIVSHSRDGQFMAVACNLLRLNVIRGSTARRDKPKEKRGVAGARASLRALRDNTMLCITVDGPRGPAEVVGMEPVKLAQQAGVPIVPYGISAVGRRLGTWDGSLLPKLFSRGAVVFGAPILATKNLDSEELRLSVESALKAVTDRADAIVARKATNLSGSEAMTEGGSRPLGQSPP